jgi:pimeloyl-ACP methyl ester carboxylesterase
MKVLPFRHPKIICALALALAFANSTFAQLQPRPPGKLCLHPLLHGKGSPTVALGNGFGDFSFDWMLVQSQVARFTRVCTYDRAGHTWSNPGPTPRTLAQINLELSS